MIKLLAKKRGYDEWGAGYFGAPRGNRTHNGVDYVAAPESIVLSNVKGRVTKLGYPYGDDLTYRYVQITDKMGNDWRYFYVEPYVDLGAEVLEGMPLGETQSLQKRYKGITDHVHLEVKDHHGNYLNPESLV